MLTSQTLATLERALHGEMVLTVYLTGAARDPAERYRWQRELEPRLERERGTEEGARPLALVEAGRRHPGQEVASRPQVGRCR